MPGFSGLANWGDEMAKKSKKADMHSDEAEDKKLIKTMVKGDCLSGKSAKKKAPKKKGK